MAANALKVRPTDRVVFGVPPIDRYKSLPDDQEFDQFRAGFADTASSVGLESDHRPARLTEITIGPQHQSTASDWFVPGSRHFTYITAIFVPADAPNIRLMIGGSAVAERRGTAPRPLDELPCEARSAPPAGADASIGDLAVFDQGAPILCCQDEIVVNGQIFVRWVPIFPMTPVFAIPYQQVALEADDHATTVYVEFHSSPFIDESLQRPEFARFSPSLHQKPEFVLFSPSLHSVFQVIDGIFGYMHSPDVAFGQCLATV